MQYSCFTYCFRPLTKLVFVWLILSGCTSDNFIRPVVGRDTGILCFTSQDENNKYRRTTECYDHQLIPPYLVMDYHHDELWSPWPEVYSLSGFLYPYAEFTDSIIGNAIQDLCEDSVRLTFHSVFRDTVSVINAVHPQSLLVPDFKVLDQLAGYQKVGFLTSLDIKEGDVLQIYRIATGCFLSTWELYELVYSAKGGSITAFAEYELQRDSTYSLSVEALDEFTEALEDGRSFYFDCELISQNSIYIKHNNSLLDLSSEKNDVRKLLYFLQDYEAAHIPKSTD